MDVTLLTLSIWAAISLRLGAPYQPPTVLSYFVILGGAVCGASVFYRFGLYRQVTRYIDATGNLRILYGVTLTMICLGMFVAVTRFESFPRSAFFLFWVIALASLMGSRRIIKLTLRNLVHHQSTTDNAPTEVLIYGAGEAGHLLNRELRRLGSHTPIYFIDDDASLWGQKVGSLKVRSPAEIPTVLSEKTVSEIFLAMPSLSRKRRREIVLSLEDYNIAVKTVPTVSEIVTGEIAISNVRPINAGDLLCRDPVPPKLEILQNAINGKCVLITGAGGSIGSEIVNQLLKLELGPKRIVLFELSEIALYQIDMKARELLEERDQKAKLRDSVEPACEIVSCLGSVLDAEPLRMIMERYDISTIYHAAAYKHVPIVELNPFTGLKNNTLGTHVLAKVAREMQVERFVLISTDKAVRPTNVMGASKRLAELTVQANAARRDSRTVFSIVRFGNVLASSGSVVHRFTKQIEQGGPVTVTHPDVTRYFMSFEEAAQLVIQSATIAKGGDLFLLDMGEPVKIDGLARMMIMLAGMKVDEDGNGASGDIAIEYTGLRPGEKLFEELLLDYKTGDTDHPRIKRCDEPFITYEQLANELDTLEKAIAEHDIELVQSLLYRLVEGYQPDSHRQTGTIEAA